MNQQIAKTILEQLGGRAFVLMTGAKNFVAGESDVSFRLPGGGGFCKDGINAVNITLMPNDTYKVSFKRIRGGKVTEVSSHDDVYFDQLPEIFRDATGLETRMPRMVRG